MIRRLPLVAWLAAAWVALWGDVSVANVATGLLIGAALAFSFRFPRLPTAAGTIRPLHAITFAGFFFWKLVEASAVVAWEVVTPRNRINEGIISVRIQGTSDTLATVVANAITLTPGTLTLEFERAPSVLYIHVLHLRSIDAVRRDVQRLERMAIRAFGSAEAMRALDAADLTGVDRGDHLEDP